MSAAHEFHALSDRQLQIDLERRLAARRAEDAARLARFRERQAGNDPHRPSDWHQARDEFRDAPRWMQCAVIAWFALGAAASCWIVAGWLS